MVIWVHVNRTTLQYKVSPRCRTYTTWANYSGVYRQRGYISYKTILSNVRQAFESINRLLVLDLRHIGRQNTLQPLVSHWQGVRIAHVHPILEEPSLLGASVVKQDHRVFDRDDAIVNALRLVSF